jgi:hypothetical protein
LALTHDLHDEYGWAEQAAAVARAHRTLPAAERQSAIVVTGNYGEASAIRFFGKRHGLPPAVTGHMSYYLWGPPADHGKLIVYGLSDAHLEQLCATRAERARTRHPLSVPKENNLPIYVCTPRAPLRELWPKLRRFNHGLASGE